MKEVGIDITHEIVDAPLKRAFEADEVERKGHSRGYWQWRMKSPESVRCVHAVIE